MSVVVWPRQEVLQLVIPQLSSVGRVLTPSCILDVVWRLSRIQNAQGQISFARWQNVAREILKWNDYCIHLFWEILVLSVYYLNADLIAESRREDIAIDLECVAIFLVLHMVEKDANKSHALSSAATASYDSVWPLNPEGEVYPSSPVASPVSSPIRESRAHRAQSPGGSSPLSPNSPRGSPQPSSPSKRSLLSGSRTPRGSTHYLHAVQQKIPLILRALCRREDVADDASVLSESLEDALDCQVNRRVVDSLGLIVCGGHSRDNTVPRFSSLHPMWANDADSSQQEALLAESTMPGTDFVRWLNVHLSMNDVLYPVSFTPVGIPVKDAGPGLDNDAFAKDGRSLAPNKHVVPLSSLSRFSPTVINGSSSTALHALTVASSRQASFRRSQRASHDSSASASCSSRQNFLLTDCEDQEMFGADPLSPSASPLPTRLSAQFSRDEEHAGDDNNVNSIINKPDTTLPQLFVSYCTRASLYMLSPYYSASITGCLDSTVVVSAVYGAVIVNGCERLRLTVACRKLIVINCIDCEFNLATLSTTIVLGDSRNLIMGPFNTSFSSLHNHLRLAELGSLAKKRQSSRQMLVEEEAFSDSAQNNLWFSICDVNSCLEAVSGSNGFVSAAGGMSGPLPSPSTSVIASVQTPDKFRAISIPWKPENLGFEFSAIMIPQEFVQNVRAQVALVEDIKMKIARYMSNIPNEMISDDDQDELTARLMSSSAISRRFMEWLVANDRMKEVLDLIRIDSDKNLHG